jgi:rare lipoprotein A
MSMGLRALPRAGGSRRRGARLPTRLAIATVVAVAWLLPLPAFAAGEGLASFYGGSFHGRRTASGQRFDQQALTAAHRTLGFGTRVRVSHKRNGRSVVVTINDRGPFVPGRVIDLSRAAAHRLGMLGAGLAPVRLEILRDSSAAQEVEGRSTGLLQELF